MIVRAQGTGSEARAALGALLQRYDKTIEGQIRAFHPPTMSVEDLKQDFFSGIIKRRDIDKVEQSQGSFRSWLFVAVRHFMRNCWARYYTHKRGERVTRPHEFHVAHEETPERHVMRSFAQQTLLLALDRHRGELGHDELFERTLRFLPGTALDLDAIAPIAAARGVTANCVMAEIHRARERHKRVLKELVADTLDVDPTCFEGWRAVQLEMIELSRLLSERPETHVQLVDA